MPDLPPPPAYECVAAPDVKTGTTFFTISGVPRQIEALLAELKPKFSWKVDADATSNGIRFVRISTGIDIPYRDIGGLMAIAQRRRLAVAITTNPIICEAEEK